MVTAGGAVYAVGLLMMATFMLASVDAAHYHLAGTAQTLNLLSNDTWIPVVVGLSLLGLGTGVSALRSATLPKWLGWVSAVFGVLALAGPAGAIAFLIAPVWALVTGIVILRSSRTASSACRPRPGRPHLGSRVNPFCHRVRSSALTELGTSFLGTLVDRRSERRQLRFLDGR